MTLIVNMFGGPGTGKSTTATEVFAKLKKQHVNAEYVNEFAKELTWQKRFDDLRCQPYVFGVQLKKMIDVIGQVDVVITDSPIFLSAIYVNDFYPSSFTTAAIDTFIMLDKTYPTLNFFIDRQKKYNPIGRNQSEDEAKAIDNKILNLLDKYQIDFLKESGDEKVAKRIANRIFDYINASKGVII